MYWKNLGPAFLAFGLCASSAPLAHGEADSQPEVTRMTEDQYGVLLRSLEYRSIREMIEQNLVYGDDGEEIGDVTDIVLGPEGPILSIVAEIDGIWETRVSVPWEDVVPNNPDDGIAGVLVPVEEDDELIFEATVSPEVAATEIREIGEQLVLTGGAWLATDLLGDWARLEGPDGPRAFGIVQDAFVERGGIFALVIRPEPSSRMPGLISVPFPHEAIDWTPGKPFVDLGYSFETLMEAPPARLEE